MAIQFLHNIDLNDNQLLNAKLHTTSSAPTAAEGQVYFDSASHHIKIHDGTRFLKAPRDIIIDDGGNTDVTLVSFQDFKLAEGGNTTFTVTGEASDAVRTLTIASDDTTYTLPVTAVTTPVAGSNGGSASITLTDSSGVEDPVAISGTPKEVDVTGNANAGTIQIGFPTDVTISGDLTINGGELFYHVNHTIKSTAAAANVAGKTLTIKGGDTTAGTTNNLAGGALTLAGGIGKGTGAGGSIIFQIAKAGSSGSSLNSLSNALTIAGDNGDATFANNVAITGNLTVSGTTTTVNSTVVTIKDPVIELGGGDGGAALSADDNLDKGVTFNWHNGTDAKLGFFGYDDSTGYFTFIPDATNTSEVFSGTAGVAELGGVRVPDSGLVLNSTAVTSTAVELNMLDAGTAGSTVTLADGDSMIIGDASASNQTKKVLLSDVKNYIAAGDKVTKKISGDANATSFNVTHSFSTPIVSVTILDYGDNGTGATYEQVFADVVRNNDNSVTISFATAPSASQDYLALITSFPAIS
jgi:hypothetical protein|tara:strand:+ start:2014 stop:3588 length:1575 start_codon:yes stop_codon:yes gene_type:complete